MIWKKVQLLTFAEALLRCMTLELIQLRLLPQAGGDRGTSPKHGFQGGQLLEEGLGAGQAGRFGADRRGDRQQNGGGSQLQWWRCWYACEKRRWCYLYLHGNFACHLPICHVACVDWRHHNPSPGLIVTVRRLDATEVTGTHSRDPVKVQGWAPALRSGGGRGGAGVRGGRECGWEGRGGCEVLQKGLQDTLLKQRLIIREDGQVQAFPGLEWVEFAKQWDWIKSHRIKRWRLRAFRNGGRNQLGQEWI